MKKLLILLLFLTVKSFAQTGTPTPPLTGPISNTLYKDANGNFWGYNGNSKYFQYVPLQTGHSGYVLSTDGTYLSWIAPFGHGTVTSLTDNTANGISVVWANRTTTPIPTITLGAITPTSIITPSLTATAGVIGSLTLQSSSFLWNNPTVTTSFGTPAQNVLMYQENGLGDAVKTIAASNAKAYFQNGTQDTTVGTMNDLYRYHGSMLSVSVRDTLRGGTFTWYATVIAPDSGVYIKPYGSLGGTWVRQVNPSTGVKAEWWPIDGSGSNSFSTANTTYFSAMYSYANNHGLGVITLSQAGTYKVRGITVKSGVRFVCPSNFSYTDNASVTKWDPVIMSIDSTAHIGTMFIASDAKNIGFDGLTADGMRSDSTLVTSCIVGNINTNGLFMSRCKIYNFKYGVDGGTGSNWSIRDNTVFRANSQNIRNLTDSKVTNVWLLGARDKSVYLNSAQVEFIGCHTEFNRGGPAKTLASPDFYLDGNAARILIADCTSDRSAGSFIICTSSGTNVPYEIHITGNHIKRVGWGTDLSNANQIAIKITGAVGVSITGNHFYGYDYGSSTAKGVWSPRYAVNATGCTHLTIKSNYNDVKQRIDLSMPTAGQNTGTKYTWKAYPPVSNVYILTLPTASSADSSAYIGAPDQLDYDHAYMTTGTLATLAAGQYVYTNGAGGYATGYTTLFAHFTNNRNPITQPIPLDSLYAEYQNLPYNIDNTNKWVETDAYQDYNPSIATTAGGTSTFQLHLNQPMQNNSQQLFTLQLVGRETTTATRNASNIQFSINKAAASAYPTVTLNNITQTVTGYTTAISGSTGLVVTSIATDGIGSMITVTLTNNEANTVTVSAAIPVIANAANTIQPVANGGTGLTSYTIGDIPYASAATTISKLADVAVGSVLVSGGTGTAPAYATALPSGITATTQTVTDNSTKVATTAYVQSHLLTGSATLDFPSTSAQTSATLTITVSGAADGDPVSLGVPNASTNANSNFTAYVSATNTVTVKFNNYSSGAIDPASGTFKVVVFK